MLKHMQGTQINEKQNIVGSRFGIGRLRLCAGKKTKLIACTASQKALRKMCFQTHAVNVLRCTGIWPELFRQSVAIKVGVAAKQELPYEKGV